jgi:hypothetical protein
MEKCDGGDIVWWACVCWGCAVKVMWRGCMVKVMWRGCAVVGALRVGAGVRFCGAEWDRACCNRGKGPRGVGAFPQSMSPSLSAPSLNRCRHPCRRLPSVDVAIRVGAFPQSMSPSVSAHTPHDKTSWPFRSTNRGCCARTACGCCVRTVCVCTHGLCVHARSV